MKLELEQILADADHVITEDNEQAQIVDIELICDIKEIIGYLKSRGEAILNKDEERISELEQ